MACDPEAVVPAEPDSLVDEVVELFRRRIREGRAAGHQALVYAQVKLGTGGTIRTTEVHLVEQPQPNGRVRPRRP